MSKRGLREWGGGWIANSVWIRSRLMRGPTVMSPEYCGLKRRRDNNTGYSEHK